MNSRFLKAVVLLALAGLAVANVAVKRHPVLREGLALAGTEGTCKKELRQGKNLWIFYPSAAIVDEKTTLPAQVGIEILPSAGLEQIRSFAGNKTSVSVKVWAVITAYRDQNFVFPLHAVPLTVQEPAGAVEEQAKPAPVPSDPNLSPVIPSEILKLLKPAGRVDLALIAESAAPKGDRAIAGKTGLISVLHNSVVFTPDGFGKKAGTDFYRLLPCQTLQQTEDRLGRSFSRQRYSVSGLAAVFEGQQYLLPYRAERTFTNGNFTP